MNPSYFGPFPGEVGPWPLFELSEPVLRSRRIFDDLDEPPQDRFVCVDPEGSWIADMEAQHPAEPGDVRLEQQEWAWERDEAEAAEERYGDDPGRVDA